MSQLKVFSSFVLFLCFPLCETCDFWVTYFVPSHFDTPSSLLLSSLSFSLLPHLKKIKSCNFTVLLVLSWVLFSFFFFFVRLCENWFLTSVIVLQGPPGLPGLKGDPGSKGEKVSVALSSSSDCRLVSFLIFDIGDNPIIRERNSGAEVSQDYNFYPASMPFGNYQKQQI